MFTVGSGLTTTDFRLVARAPKTVVLASLAQIVCLPLAGLVVVKLVSPNEFVASGVLLIAACPGGSISNFYVYLARANVALSVVLTGISTILAVVTMPLVLSVFERFEATPRTFDFPVTRLMLSLVLFLLLPTVLGMLLRHFRPGFVLRHDRWLRGGSMVLLAVLVVQVLWQARGFLALDLADTIKSSAAMAGLAILAGFLVGRAMRLEANDFWPVVIEMMARNLALASTISLVVFQQIRFVSLAAVYFLIQVPIAAVLILICLRAQAAGRVQAGKQP